MGKLDRRLDRLESRAGEEWSLTRLLEWVAAPSGNSPSGRLIDCLETLPIVQRSEGAT